MIAIYSRKSRFTGKGESIGNQTELCRAYIGTVYGPEAQNRIRVFEDEGFSGGDLNRPGFQAMVQAARNGEISTIVVYRLDRISRNIGDFAGFVQELTRLEISFVSIREQFDTGSPMGRAMMYIISVFSQLERETIAQRIRDNMLELAKTGRWLGGNTPTGFCSQGVTALSADGKSRKTYHLCPNPQELEVVKLIFKLYGETRSLTGTEEQLRARGILTKNERPFTRFAIRDILKNPVYMVADRTALRYFTAAGAQVYGEEDADGSRGIMAYNRTDQEKGRTARENPMQDWIVAVGQHPGVVPAEIWIRTQQQLRSRRRTATGQQVKNGTPGEDIRFF